MEVQQRFEKEMTEGWKNMEKLKLKDEDVSIDVLQWLWLRSTYNVLIITGTHDRKNNLQYHSH